MPAKRSEASKVYTYSYTCNTIKKTAAKPPAERSAANKVLSEARLIKYYLIIHVTKIRKTETKPPADRSEAHKCIYLLTYEIKIVTNILMGFKISCQVGVVLKNFKITKGR